MVRRNAEPLEPFSTDESYVQPSYPPRMAQRTGPPSAPPSDALHLVNVLRTGTREVKEKAARDIGIGALGDPLFSEAVAAADGISLLISLLPVSQSAKADDYSVAAVGALKELSFHQPNRNKMADSGGVPRLLSALSKGSSEAAIALWNLSFEDYCRKVIVDSGGIPEVLKAMLYLEMGEAMSGILANLATDSHYSFLVGEAGGIKPLLTALEHGSTGVMLQAALALGRLSLNSANRVEISEGNGISLLLDRLQDGTSGEVETAAGALMNIAHENELMKLAIANELGVEPLINVLSSGSPLAQEYAVGTLLNLCEGDDHTIKQLVWDAGVHAPLLRLQDTGMGNTKKYAEDLQSSLAVLPSVWDFLEQENLKQQRQEEERIHQQKCEELRRRAVKHQRQIVSTLQNGDVELDQLVNLVVDDDGDSWTNIFRLFWKKPPAKIQLLQSSIPVELKNGLSMLPNDKSGAYSFFKSLCRSTDKKLKADAELLLLLCAWLLKDMSCTNSPLLQRHATDLKKSGVADYDGHCFILHLVCCLLSSDSISDDNKLLSFTCGLQLLCQREAPFSKDLMSMVRDNTEFHLPCAVSHVTNMKPPSIRNMLETPKEQWESVKRDSSVQNSGLDGLMNMTGLDSVKEKFLDIYFTMQTAIEQCARMDDKRYGVLLCGNPGTGKTTVARHYGKFLTDLRVLKGNEFVETSGSKLTHEGIDGLKKLLDDIEQKGGGILFVDEAYQLDPDRELNGRRILNYLLTEMENRVGKLVVAFAGYQDEIEKLIAFNEGFPRRFPYNFKFADYKDEELFDILVAVVDKTFTGNTKPNIQGGTDRSQPKCSLWTITKRVGRGRGTRGFGNAGAIQNEWQRIRERQAARVSRERREKVPNVDVLLFSQEDILGPRPKNVLKTSSAWKKLQNMIGLTQVKETVRALFQVVDDNYERELLGQDPRFVTLNRLFLGNPGTGKTTVAGLYGKVLKELGLLTNGEVVLKNPSDFIGSAVGESLKNTNRILAATKGKVLVIDEAYGLYPGENPKNPYCEEVISTIVAEVQNLPGDDRCVLMLGYEDQMRELVDKSNPGLKGRFNPDDAFHFADYSKDDLWQILNLKVSEMNVICTLDAQFAAIEVLEKEKRRPNFRNGGSVNNLLSRAELKRQARLQHHSSIDRVSNRKLLPEDFDPQWTAPGSSEFDVRDLFADLTGCTTIVAQLQKYQNSVAFNAKKGGADKFENVDMAFRFQGSPGTGKTTVARRMGDFFYNLGLLATNEIVEVSASDLVSRYVGNSAKDARELFKKSLGSVLFIDEAYRLGESQFGRETLNEICQMMTEDTFKRKLVVILAGYPRELESLVRINPGLPSRFPVVLPFHDLTPNECVDVLCKRLKSKGYEIRDINRSTLADYFFKLIKMDNWGNARDVELLARKVIDSVIDEYTTTQKPIEIGVVIQMSMTLIVKCLSEFLQARLEADKLTAVSSFNTLLEEPEEELGQDPLMVPAPPVTQTTEQHTVRIEELTEEELPPESCEGPAGRDPGISDAVWENLQYWKQVAEEEARKLKEYEDRLAAERREIERLLKEKRQREAEEARKKMEELQRQAEEMKRKAAEEKRRQQQLRVMGQCEAGYSWINIGGNRYQCAGGSHYYSFS